MSDYKTINGKKARLCKYECGTTIMWDNSKSVFFEPDGQVHTLHRCKSIKEGKKSKGEVTLQAVQKRLESIGISINLEKLMKQ